MRAIYVRRIKADVRKVVGIYRLMVMLVLAYHVVGGLYLLVRHHCHLDTLVKGHDLSLADTCQ